MEIDKKILSSRTRETDINSLIISDMEIIVKDPQLSEILNNYNKALEILSKIGKYAYTTPEVEFNHTGVNMGYASKTIKGQVQNHYAPEEEFCRASIKILLDRITKDIIEDDIIGKNPFPYEYDLSYVDNKTNKLIHISGNQKDPQEMEKLFEIKERNRASCYSKNLNQNFYKIGYNRQSYKNFLQILTTQLYSSPQGERFYVLNKLNELVYEQLTSYCVLNSVKRNCNFHIYDKLLETNPKFAPYYVKKADSRLLEKERVLECEKAEIVAEDKDYIKQKCAGTFEDKARQDDVVFLGQSNSLTLKLHLEWTPQDPYKVLEFLDELRLQQNKISNPDKYLEEAIKRQLEQDKQGENK